MRIIPALDEFEDGEPGLGLRPEAPPIEELVPIHLGDSTVGLYGDRAFSCHLLLQVVKSTVA